MLLVAGVLLEPGVAFPDHFVVLAERVLAHRLAVQSVRGLGTVRILLEIGIEAGQRIVVLPGEQVAQGEAVVSVFHVGAAREFAEIILVALLGHVVLPLGKLRICQQELHLLAQVAAGLLLEHPSEVAFRRLGIVVLQSRRAQQIAYRGRVRPLGEFLEVRLALPACLRGLV